MIVPYLPALPWARLSLLFFPHTKRQTRFRLDRRLLTFHWIDGRPVIWVTDPP